MKKKEFEQLATDYMENQQPLRATDFNGKKMTWKRAFVYTLFDSFFFGLKWAIGIIFFLLFWATFNSLILIQYAEKVCPIIK